MPLLRRGTFKYQIKHKVMGISLKNKVSSKAGPRASLYPAILSVAEQENEADSLTFFSPLLWITWRGKAVRLAEVDGAAVVWQNVDPHKLESELYQSDTPKGRVLAILRAFAFCCKVSGANVIDFDKFTFLEHILNGSIAVRADFAQQNLVPSESDGMPFTPLTYSSTLN